MKFVQQRNVMSDSEYESSQNQANQDELIKKEEENIKKQLKNVPYELILKQKELMKPKQATHKLQNPQKKSRKTKKIVTPVRQFKDAAVQIDIHQKTFKKNKPIFEPKRPKTIDPRFQSYAGNYNSDLAMKSYDFIPKMQEREISELKSKLKNKKKKGHKLNEHERQVLIKNYNQLTSDHKRLQLSQLQKEVKKSFKAQGKFYHPKDRQVKDEFEKRKLQKLSDTDREKRIKEKNTKIEKTHQISKIKLIRNKY